MPFDYDRWGTYIVAESTWPFLFKVSVMCWQVTVVLIPNGQLHAGLSRIQLKHYNSLSSTICQSFSLTFLTYWRKTQAFTFSVNYQWKNHYAWCLNHIASLTVESGTKKDPCLFNWKETIKLPVQIKMDLLPGQSIWDSQRWSPESILR